MCTIFRSNMNIQNPFVRILVYISNIPSRMFAKLREEFYYLFKSQAFILDGEIKSVVDELESSLVIRNFRIVIDFKCLNLDEEEYVILVDRVVSELMIRRGKVTFKSYLCRPLRTIWIDWMEYVPDQE